MKKLFIGISIVCFCLSIISCDDYVHSTNRYGDVELYSGGKLVKSYKNVKISYSTFAIGFTTETGNRFYWQGEAFISLK